MLIRLCLGVALPLALGAAQPENLPAGWRVFASKEGGFAVALPDAPTETKQRVRTATGHLDVYLFVVEGKDGSAYVVTYSDLPPEEVRPGAEDKRLDFAREGAVDNARGKLRSEKKITVDGFPGRDLLIETPKDLAIRMKIIVARRRLYQAMAMGTGRFVHSKDAALFLDSLRLDK